MKIINNLHINQTDIISESLKYLIHSGFDYEIIGWCNDLEWIIIKTNDNDTNKDDNSYEFIPKINILENENLIILHYSHIKNSKELVKGINKYKLDGDLHL